MQTITLLYTAQNYPHMGIRRYRGILTKDDRKALDRILDENRDSLDTQMEVRIRRRAQQGLVDLCLLDQLYAEENKVITDAFEQEISLPFADDQYTSHTIQAAIGFLLGEVWSRDEQQAERIIEQALQQSIETTDTIVQIELEVSQDNRDDLLSRIYEQYRNGEELDGQESRVLLDAFRDYGSKPQSENEPTERAVLLREEIANDPTRLPIKNLLADNIDVDEVLSSDPADSDGEQSRLEYESGSVLRSELQNRLPDLVCQLKNGYTLTLHMFRGELSQADYESVCEEIENASGQIALIVTPSAEVVHSEVFEKHDFKTDIKRIHSVGVAPKPPLGGNYLFDIDTQPTRVY